MADSSDVLDPEHTYVSRSSDGSAALRRGWADFWTQSAEAPEALGGFGRDATENVFDTEHKAWPCHLGGAGGNFDRELRSWGNRRSTWLVPSFRSIRKMTSVTPPRI